jgi:hypothetical protein
MLTTLLRIACVVVALVAAAGVSLAAGASFEGNVKDPKGRLLRGAEVRIVKNGKIVSKVKTDADGHYVSGAVAPGAYEIDLVVSSVIIAKFESVKAGAAGTKEMNFDLKNAPRRIWVVDTGTNIGRWIDLDDPSTFAPAGQFYRADADWLRRMQDRTAGAMGR